MRNSQQYRTFAEECERLATQTANQRHRTILKEMALAWRQLADRAHQAMEREKPGKPS